ncbi:MULTISPECIES: hypothetical protein [unclassified Sphingomonas]|uniref:hypothetical protein n=1 Tax=unclassified Sphingomonas TaxID=196159 RepID=UPI0006FA0974|nr:MULTISPECIES: hypothetical protein [unclassified Sphingomonas]KQN06368.1 hypothetical protein ASE78_15500 [Sphingomonas sp. Leaf25]KQN40399.1 hypothetical protein ASE97_00910 [Sphingomonas sp. Leaf42]KQT29753.1 hypothetical protein ASG37_00880 [Sphingomonas sp. Leaf407]
MAFSTLIAALFLTAAPSTAATVTVTAPLTGAMRDGTPLSAGTKICIRSPRPASHLPLVECRRYADWLAEGVNPTKLRRIR